MAYSVPINSAKGNYVAKSFFLILRVRYNPRINNNRKATPMSRILYETFTYHMKGSTIILLPFSSKILYCLLFSIGFFTNFIMELIILIVNLGFYEDLNSFQLIFKEYGKGAVRIHFILMSNMFCVKFPWFDTVNC